MPEDFSTDIRATEQMVRQWQERATEKAERYGRMQERIEQVSATETSSDGAVQVTVDSNGTLRNLELSASAGNRPMSQLAAEIMRVAQAARAKVPDLMQDAIADTVGMEDTAAQHILSEARRTFPQPEDEQPGQQSAPERGDFEDDDFSGGSFLR